MGKVIDMAGPNASFQKGFRLFRKRALHAPLQGAV